MILKGTVTIRNEAVMVVDCGEIVIQFPASDHHVANVGESVSVQLANGTYKTVDNSFVECPDVKKEATKKKMSAKAEVSD